MRVKGLRIKTTKGEVQTLALQPVSLDTVTDFTPANAFGYLVSAPSLLSADAESLVVDFTLWTENVEKVASGNNPKISLEFKNSGEQLLTKILGPTFKASGTIPEKTLRLAVPLGTVKQAAGTANMKAIVKVRGANSQSRRICQFGTHLQFQQIGRKSDARSAHKRRSSIT